MAEAKTNGRKAYACERCGAGCSSINALLEVPRTGPARWVHLCDTCVVQYTGRVEAQYCEGCQEQDVIVERSEPTAPWLCSACRRAAPVEATR